MVAGVRTAVHMQPLLLNTLKQGGALELEFHLISSGFSADVIRQPSSVMVGR